MLFGEVSKIKLEKNEADHVFEQLAIGVGLEVFLAEQRLDAGDGLVIVIRLNQDSARSLGVKLA